MLRTETANNMNYSNRTSTSVGTVFLETTVKPEAFSNILKNATVLYYKETEYSIVQNTASSCAFKNTKI